MNRYKNLSGISGVLAYEIGVDSITVKFNSFSEYVYTYRSAGVDIIERMKSLAILGRGLNGFILKCAKNKFESKRR